MNLDKSKLRQIIHESMGLNESTNHVGKIIGTLKSFDRNFIIQAYQLCEVMPNLDFQKIVRFMVRGMLDEVQNYNRIHNDVTNMLEILHSNKLDTFYIQNENTETDVQMDCVYKTVADIEANLENYYVDYFTAIGKGLWKSQEEN